MNSKQELQEASILLSNRIRFYCGTEIENDEDYQKAFRVIDNYIDNMPPAEMKLSELLDELELIYPDTEFSIKHDEFISLVENSYSIGYDSYQLSFNGEPEEHVYFVPVIVIDKAKSIIIRVCEDYNDKNATLFKKMIHKTKIIDDLEGM